MGNKVIGLGGEILHAEHKTYNLTPGLTALITYKRPPRIEYTDDDYTASLHRPRLQNSRITQVVLDHALHGNGSICSGKWLHLWKA